MKNKENRRAHCVCGSTCMACTAEELSVTCGTSQESFQYDYGLQEKLTHNEHESEDLCGTGHHDHETAMGKPSLAAYMEQDMRRRFFISLFFSLPIVLIRHLGPLLGFSIHSSLFINGLFLTLTSILVWWPASPFLNGAYYSLKNFDLNMSVLLATGITVSYGASILIMLIGGHGTFFDATAMLVSSSLFGHWMEMKARHGTFDAMRALFDLVPSRSTVIRNGKQITLATAEILIGNIVVIKPGEKIPVDGEIVEGTAEVDMSLVTGESMPVVKHVGDTVIAGAINTTNVFKMKATKIGSNTTLAHIIKLIQQAQESKAPGQLIADKAAQYLTVIALGSGLCAFIWWYIFSDSTLLTAISFAASAIVIACPDALGLATPVAVAVATGLGARENILFKNAQALEDTSKITAVLLDKTGTLTEGHAKVAEIIPLSGTTKKELLFFAGSAQKFSDHPISKAIVTSMEEENISPAEAIENARAIAGQGVTAEVDGKKVIIGSLKFLSQNDIATQELENEAKEFLQESKSISAVAIDRKPAGFFTTIDPIKTGTKKAIAELKQRGIQVTMVTGDHETIAQEIANKLGIDDIFAEVMPKDKAICVKKLQDRGYFVAMVGDGINDAPALATANVGIAIGAGTDVAIQTANIILMQSNPLDIVTAYDLSKATTLKMKQNLAWAAGYNMITIPLAAGVFYNTMGFALRPEIAALFMSSSTIFVTVNALLLKKFKR